MSASTRRRPTPIAQDLRGVFIIAQFAPQNVHIFRSINADSNLSSIDGQNRRTRKESTLGEASTRELRRQIAGKHVVVGWYKRDRWKRLIGVVRLAGEDMNLAHGRSWLGVALQAVC